jgi:hypothetical protein
MRIPIRDCRAEPWPDETDALRPSQALYDEIARAQAAWDLSREDYLKENLIDPNILEEERQFAIQRGGL